MSMLNEFIVRYGDPIVVMAVSIEAPPGHYFYAEGFRIDLANTRFHPQACTAIPEEYRAAYRESLASHAAVVARGGRMVVLTSGWSRTPQNDNPTEPFSYFYDVKRDSIDRLPEDLKGAQVFTSASPVDAPEPR